MAEQLSTVVYKPWMKGNFNSLKINSVPVLTNDDSAYFQGNCTTQVLNPLPENFNISFTTASSKNITLSSDIQIEPDISGTYYCSANVVFNITGQPNLQLYLYLSFINNTTGETLKSGGIFNNSSGVLVQNINISGLLKANAGELITLTVNTFGSADTNTLTVYGSDSNYSSTFTVYKISNI